jgi:hypothetical protein
MTGIRLPRCTPALLFIGLTLAVFPQGRRQEPKDGGANARSSAAAVPGIPGPGGTLIHDGDQVELEGRIRLLGSEPFPDMVLTGADGQDWYLEGPARRTFQPYEQRTVKVRGRVELREMVLANGRSLGFRRCLVDPELLEN